MSAPRNPHLSSLWNVDRAAAVVIVQDALRGRTIEEAAKALGVGRRTLHRWLKEKGIRT